MKSKKMRRVLIGVLGAFLLLVIAGNAAPKGPFKGVSLSPREYSEEAFLDFLDKTKETGNMVSWAGDWMELSSQEGPIILAELSKKYKYTPLVAVGHYIQETGELIRPLDNTTRKTYKKSALDFIKKYKPQHFVMGVETNVFAQKNPEGYDEFVTLYNELYDEIKAISPKTLVFTAHQLETMKGHAFWSTSAPNESKTQWELLGDFKSDLAVFTTYPGLVYKDPSDIPGDYYTQIREHTDLPIGFLEVGWHSSDFPPGWESSAEEQAEFVDTYFALTKSLNPVISIWPFMFDPVFITPFDSMGLIDKRGVKRASWHRWVENEVTDMSS